jgi:hypothetical protein
MSTSRPLTFKEVIPLDHIREPSGTTFNDEVVIEPSGRDPLSYDVRNSLMMRMNETTFSYERGKFRCSVREDIYEKLIREHADGTLECNLGFRKNKEWLVKVTRMHVIV